MNRSHGWLASLLGLALGAIFSVTCAPPYPPGGDCRVNPNCAPVNGLGGNGAYCNSNNDCASNHCCERDECDGGTCTYQCKNDSQCPAGLLCQHDTCFFACNNDGDCAPGQDCKHDRVCEW